MSKKITHWRLYLKRMRKQEPQTNTKIHTHLLSRKEKEIRNLPLENKEFEAKNPTFFTWLLQKKQLFSFSGYNLNFQQSTIP